MPYTPPSGWVERLEAVPEGRGQITRFHTRQDCPAIPEGAVLAASDKPYSATRCHACAH